MAKSSRGRAPRDKKPSLKLPEWPYTPKPPQTPPPPRPSQPVGSIPGPDFKKGDEEVQEEALREAFNASSTKKRSVSRARKWIEAFKLSINCELIESCAMTSLSAALVLTASRWTTWSMAATSSALLPPAASPIPPSKAASAWSARFRKRVNSPLIPAPGPDTP